MPRKRTFWVMLSAVSLVIMALLATQPWHAQAGSLVDSAATDADAIGTILADRGDEEPDEFDRDDDFDDDEEADDERGDEERDFDGEEEFEEEVEWMEHEMHRLEIEYLELETIDGLAEIVESEVGSAALALTHLQQLFDEEAALASFLSEALNETEHPGIKRLLRFKLAELHFGQDQPDQARSQLRHLITGK